MWWPISRQVYADVGKNGKVERIDTFNGNYGLNRGLSAACVALAIVAATQTQWHVVIGFLVLASCSHTEHTGSEYITRGNCTCNFLFCSRAERAEPCATSPRAFRFSCLLCPTRRSAANVPAAAAKVVQVGASWQRAAALPGNI